MNDRSKTPRIMPEWIIRRPHRVRRAGRTAWFIGKQDGL